MATSMKIQGKINNILYTPPSVLLDMVIPVLLTVKLYQSLCPFFGAYAKFLENFLKKFFSGKPGCAFIEAKRPLFPDSHRYSG